MDNYFGGKLIATGSSSCIINPNIKCVNNKYKKRNKKKISKITFGDDANKLSVGEKRINDIIKRIPGSNKWALLFDKLCNPPSFKESFKIDKDILKCIKGDDEINFNSNLESKIKSFNIQSKMLIGELGGITLNNHIDKHFIKIKNLKKLEKEFMEIMRKMEYLFIGLISLNKYNIIHLDIKPDNIVISNEYFKFIDFGFSNTINNIEHFKKRSYEEFKTERIYLWYPLDYIFFNLSNDELNTELQKIDKEGMNDFRKHMDVYIEIQTFFGYNPEKDFLYLLKKYKSIDFNKLKSEYKNIIKGIDTYSLGMLFPTMFYINDMLNYVNDSNILFEFFNLFKEMCNPDHKQRIHISEAYNTFKKLLNKYSKKKVSKRKEK